MVTAIALWIAIVLIWATRSQFDVVPTGLDTTLNPPQPVSVRVECSRILSWSARPDTPLPTLKPQPAGAKQLSYRRSPCVRWHNQGRILLVLDALFAFLVGALAFVVLKRRAKQDELGESM